MQTVQNDKKADYKELEHVLACPYCGQLFLNALIPNSESHKILMKKISEKGGIVKLQTKR